MIPVQLSELAVAGHRLARVIGRQPREVLQPLARDEAVVDRDAHLAVLDGLGREHLLDRFCVDAVLGEDRRALAAQLERDGDELLGRGLRDLAADRRAARVEEVIPANARERTCKLETADDDIDAIAVERRANHLAQELAAGRRVLRRLDHDPIPGGEHLDERTDGEVEREIPGNDVADHALGLGLHERAPGAVQRRICVAGLGRHPAAELLGRIRSASRRTEHFDQIGRDGGCTPKSLLNASSICVAVAHQHPASAPSSAWRSSSDGNGSARKAARWRPTIS